MRDIIVIGGGPAGSTAATLLAGHGFSVLLLERERFPRFQIGESLLPYNNDLFDRLGVRDQLRRGDFFPKYGASFITGDGKIGTTFRFDQNLPEQYQSAFQVKRAQFDELLLRNAARSGVEIREGTAVASVDLADPARAVVQTATGERHEARFVLDASGHGALLGNRIGEKEDVASLTKVAFFGHYRGVPRPDGRDAGNTAIVVLQNAWLWLIPVNEELTSVGLVVDRDHVLGCGLEPEELLNRTIAATPWVAERMHNAERVTQVYARRDFSYRMNKIVGENYALIGDAAGFLDPIFSTGVFIAMKSAEMAATAVEQKLRRGSTRLLKRYEREVTDALSKYFRFITNFYRREFLEVFLQPSPRFGLLPVIVGVLAGNVFATRSNRLKLALFFSLVAIQKRRKVIAPPIVWDTLPAAASV
ncbi:MAG TPA: NAD(P)/FAD-dependent oxidoreductase [Thermoanaerobaculia bacterium]|nr:NAD(P)/FAD-dependent oxidoreductase [Thermoanaerobaculia bacterium]